MEREHQPTCVPVGDRNDARDDRPCAHRLQRGGETEELVAWMVIGERQVARREDENGGRSQYTGLGSNNISDVRYYPDKSPSCPGRPRRSPLPAVRAGPS